MMASPVSSLLESSLFSSNLNAMTDPMENKSNASNCDFCLESCVFPQVLSCLHTSCSRCLEGFKDMQDDTVNCPICQQKFPFPHPDLPPTLVQDFAALLDPAGKDSFSIPSCGGCKSSGAPAEGQCLECNSYICSSCLTAHEFMHCFHNHQVIKNGDINGSKEFGGEQHASGLHDSLHEVGQSQQVDVSDIMSKSSEKLMELQRAEKLHDKLVSRLEMNYQKAKCDMEETLKFLITTAQEHKEETLKELDNFYNTAKLGVALYHNKIKSDKEMISSLTGYISQFQKTSNLSQMVPAKQTLDTKLQKMASSSMDLNPQIVEIEFSSNFQAIQSAIKNVFGYVRNEVESVPPPKPLPIARPSSVINSEYSYTNGHVFDSISKKFGSTNSLVPFSTSLSDITPYEKWSNGPGSDILQHGIGDAFPTADTMSDISSKFMSACIYPVKSNLKRQKMIYHCKFGEFGVMEGQFTEPSGVAVNAQNDIIVADTNNHRIQIFDKEGRFKFHFGECGKRDGQLLYPNRVAVVKTSGDIVVTERSPTHQIQIYNQYGQFVRKFGANILQHPRGVTVDNKGRIIVAECKVMRVIIFDQLGNVLQKFGCSKHLEFPNGVVVNDKQEIFISDNRAHCVKVFNYEGVFLRQIGGEGLTNYPIGVCINSIGEILVADNHNNFNITIFTQDGELINASESKVKHAQCFDVALMDDGSVVLASKDYRLYIYRYVQQPGLNMAL